MEGWGVLAPGRWELNILQDWRTPAPRKCPFKGTLSQGGTHPYTLDPTQDRAVGRSRVGKAGKNSVLGKVGGKQAVFKAQSTW